MAELEEDERPDDGDPEEIDFSGSAALVRCGWAASAGDAGNGD